MDSGFQGTPYEYWLINEYRKDEAKVVDLETLSLNFGDTWVKEFRKLMSTETIAYEGDDIIIEEMPQGCVLTQVSHTGRGITIASTQDALAVIESLQRLLEFQLRRDNNES